MILQVKDLLNAVFRKLQVATKGINTDPTEMNNALQDLNIMLDELSGDSLICMGSVMVPFTLTPGKPSYTIGQGADFNGIRPNRITDAFVRDAAGNDYPLTIISLTEYNAFALKTIDVGIPSCLYYDTSTPQQSTPQGTVNIWPNPDAAYTLFLGEQQPLNEFSALTDVVTFLPVYYSMLMWNLTERLYPEYPVMDDKSFALVQKMALNSQKVIENLNFKAVASADLGLPITDEANGRWFNIVSGQFE